MSITPPALEALLENALERALVLSGGMIDAGHVTADAPPA